MTRRLSTAQLDRAAGVLLGMACGDALGAGYEFGPPLAPHVPVAMTGGRGFRWEPGEWTDDTSMAIAIAEVSATGADLRSVGARDQIAARWAGWAAKAKDVGNQTRAVLSTATRAARTRGEIKPTAADLAAAAGEHHAADGPFRRQRIADADRTDRLGLSARPGRPGSHRAGDQRDDPSRS